MLWYGIQKGFDGKYEVVELHDDDYYIAMGYDSKYHPGVIYSSQVKTCMHDQGLDVPVSISHDKDALEELAAKKNNTLLTAEEASQLSPDITGYSVKTAKKGQQYNVIAVKTSSWSSPNYYVVDVKSGLVVAEKSYWLDDAKYVASKLDEGVMTPTSFADNAAYGCSIELPPSAQQQQKQLLNPKPTKPKKEKKPLGANATEIASATSGNGYVIYEMKDGSYGFFVPSTGASNFGYKYKGFAEKAAKKGVQAASATQMQYMGMDPANTSVEQLLGAYEDRMRAMYSQAANEMAAKQAAHLAKYESALNDMRARLAKGEITQEQFDGWLRSQQAQMQWNDDMVKSLAQDAVEADKKAMDMLNGYVPSAYAEGMNFATFQIEQGAGINTGFALYNKEAVARLVQQPNAPLLPKPSVDIDADTAWSNTKLNAAISQSILQGESIPRASQRLMKVLGMSANQSMRTARTALTGAMNAGRLDAARRAIKMGIKLKKQWVATFDSRTRTSHRALDRETVEVEETFSNGCMQPGDPAGAPEEVYNCRCAMRMVVEGHEYDDLPDDKDAYDAWKDEHLTKSKAKVEKLEQEKTALESSMNDIKKRLPNDKDYSSEFGGNIIKGSSKLSDWNEQAVKDSEEFYFKKLQNAIATNNQYDIDWYKKRLMQLAKYDTEGRAYYEAHELLSSQIKVIEDKLADVTSKLKKLAPHSSNAFSEERRAAALRWADKAEADRVLRPSAGRVWREATNAEKRAINTYTGSAYPDYNNPLNGYEGNPHYNPYVGVGVVDINACGRGREIRQMTNILERCSTEQDMIIRRGDGIVSLDTVFGFEPGTLKRDYTTQEAWDSLIGRSGRFGGFLSCGTAADSGAGFGGELDMELFLPAGSHAMYVEPISQCGWGDGLSWDGISGQSMFSREDETIIQRGASFTLTGVEYNHGRVKVYMEHHPEDGYDLFQQ